MVGERDRAVWEGEELKAANLRVCAGWQAGSWEWVAEQGVHYMNAQTSSGLSLVGSHLWTTALHLGADACS